MVSGPKFPPYRRNKPLHLNLTSRIPDPGGVGQQQYQQTHGRKKEKKSKKPVFFSF